MRVFAIAVITIVLLVLGCSAASYKNSNKKRYDDFSVFKIKLHNLEQKRMLEKLAENTEHFNVWHSSSKELHIMVSPGARSLLQNVTRTIGVEPQNWIPNVQRLIDDETQANVPAANATLDWTQYYPLEAIEEWLSRILTTYPDITQGFIVGESYQRRQIRGIKISYKAGNPGIFIESNIHAREWITSATATWLINELLTSTVPEVRALAENHDWYIVPVLNVDGFVYTHERDRMWRKTRQPFSNSACLGADPNRNFDSHWLENNGASSEPCSQTYAGPRPFSEPEISSLSRYISNIKNKIHMLLAFHSYSQLILSPFGHTAELFPPNYDDLMAVAKAYSDAVGGMPYHTQYEYGSTAAALYVATGATSDWAYNEMGIQLSYTIEFRDKGRFGFVLPPVQILPNCEETLNGLLAMVKEATRLGYLPSV